MDKQNRALHRRGARRDVDVRDGHLVRRGDLAGDEGAAEAPGARVDAVERHALGCGSSARCGGGGMSGMVMRRGQRSSRGVALFVFEMGLRA